MSRSVQLTQVSPLVRMAQPHQVPGGYRPDAHDPGMVVINPADDVEARAAVHAAYDHAGPVYLRFGRLPVPVFNDEVTYKFEIGKGIVLKEGKDVTIFCNRTLCE